MQIIYRHALQAQRLWRFVNPFTSFIHCEACSFNCCSFVYHISCNYIKQSHFLEGDSRLAGKQIPHLSWNLKIHHCVQHSLTLEIILSQINPVNTHTPHFFMINFNIENCILLGYYAVRSVDFLLTFQENLPVQSSRLNFWILDQRIWNR